MNMKGNRLLSALLAVLLTALLLCTAMMPAMAEGTQKADEAAVTPSAAADKLYDTIDANGYAYFGIYCSHKRLNQNFYIDDLSIIEKLPENVMNMIHERRTKAKPLTEEQRSNNNKKSKIRCRIEHIFGFMTNSMRGITVRSIGIERAAFNIGLINLIYNLCRYEFLVRPAKKAA